MLGGKDGVINRTEMSNGAYNSGKVIEAVQIPSMIISLVATAIVKNTENEFVEQDDLSLRGQKAIYMIPAAYLYLIKSYFSKI